MKIAKIIKKLYIIFSHLKTFLFKEMYNQYFLKYDKKAFGYIGKNVSLGSPIYWSSPRSIFIGDNTRIWGNAKFIISTREGNFIIKENCFVGQGLTVITNNHCVNPPIELLQFSAILNTNLDINKDVVIEDDVWIGSNVTLLPGVKIGRGAIIGAGSVVTNDVLPYSIVAGNPAKLLRFKYSKDEIINHEKIFYSKNLRVPLQELEKFNYS